MRFLYYIVVILHCISFVFVNCISCIAYCEIEPAYRNDKLTYVAKAARMHAADHARRIAWPRYFACVAIWS